MTVSEIEQWAAVLVTDRNSFNNYAYFSIHDALAELEKRQAHPSLGEYLKNILPHGVPDVLAASKNIALFRHIATPNYEIRRFFILTEPLEHLRPIVLEYTHDKFTNRNDWKFSLAKIPFYKGENSKKESLFEFENIIDVNTSNNKPISEIETNWKQSLVDFHHEMFQDAFPKLKDNIFDLSHWLQKNGGSAREYYKSFLSLFLKNGILLENFLLDGKESEFTKTIILPVLKQIEEETGMKPLIVALEPTEVESNKFWLAHPYIQKEHLHRKKEKLPPEGK